MPLIGDTADIHRHAQIVGGDGDLESAHLIHHMTIAADGIGGAGEEVNALTLHDIGGHIVGNDRHIKAHVVADGGGKARPLEERTGLGAEHTHLLPLLAALAEHHAQDGLGEALGHDCAAIGDEGRQVLTHLPHAGVTAVIGADGEIADIGCHIPLTVGNGLAGCLQAAARNAGHTTHGGGAGMGNDIGGVLQIFQLLGSVPIAALIGRQCHGHSGGGEGARGLGHHVTQCLHHLFIGAAGDELHLAGIYAAVENADFTAVVPRHVFILQHESQTLVCSFHDSLSFSRHEPRGGSIGLVDDFLFIQCQIFPVFIEDAAIHHGQHHIAALHTVGHQALGVDVGR